MAEILQFAFMQKALIAGVVLAALLAFLGIFTVLRKMSFFGDGIAHASLFGIAIGIIASTNPFIIAIIFGIIFALLIYWIEKRTNLYSDAVIGILFTTSMSLGVILISLKSGYQPELISFLFGNILAIKTSELFIIIILGLFVALFLTLFYKKLTLLTLDKEGAYLAGIKTDVLEIAFNIALAISIILGIKILGIVLVSALLIIPASSSKLIASSFKSLTWISIVLSEIIVILGLVLSYYLNLPSGAMIVVTGFAIFLIMLVLRNIKKFSRI